MEMRREGDTALRGYSGDEKKFIHHLQLILKVDLATNDAYPKTDDFEDSIKQLFAIKVKEGYTTGCG